MAQNIQPQQVQKVAAAPQHYAPPTARELRAQVVHRLQVGLFGLAAMLLLVGLANIIMERARLNDEFASDPVSVSSPESAQSPGSDPLADIGVVPSAEPTVDTGRPGN